MASIRVREIFRSIQGESTLAGWPCVFIRTTGCDIRCVYCDEPEAFSGGETLTLDEILLRIKEFGLPLVAVTGGEPLLQQHLPELVQRLVDEGYQVLIETGGHHDISGLDPRAHVILDVKSPGSGMQSYVDLENLDRMGEGDELKIVLCDRHDYEWARDLIRARRLEFRFPVSFSPVHPDLDPRLLARWILEDRLRVRVNLQLHKYVWGSETTGV